MWEYDSVGQTKLKQVAGWTHAWPRKCKLEALYGPAIFVYVHTQGSGRPLPSAVPLSPDDAPTWVFRSVREEENREREKERRMGSIPYFDAGLKEVAGTYGKMARDGKAFLAALSSSDSDSDSGDIDEGSTAPAAFDASIAFTITSGPDHLGEYCVRQGKVSRKVSEKSLGEVAINTFKASQAEVNKKAVAAILSGIEAKSATWSDADTEARIDREFDAVMGEIEATGRMSGRDKDVDPHGPGVANVEADPGAQGLEASGVKHYVTKKRSDGPPSAGLGSALPTVDCGGHPAQSHRT